VDVDVPGNTVLVGPPTLLRVNGFDVDRQRWAGPVAHGAVEVQIRAHGEPVPARLEAGSVALQTPLTGVAPGQIAVFYDGTRVLGSGRITRTR
jgi:tRNA-specific 2-thiouridylase